MLGHLAYYVSGSATTATATAESTLPALTTAATATARATATAANTLPALTQAATATVSGPPTASATSVLPALTQAATVSARSTATAESTLPALTQAATGVAAGALNSDFPGTSLPSDWTFESPLAGGSHTVSGSRVNLSLPAGTSYDSISSVGSADNSAGITHEIPSHSGDIDIAVQVDTDVSDMRGHGINLLCKGSGTDAVRFAWYHNDTGTADEPKLFGYARAGGSGAQIGNNAAISTFMTGLPSWLRIKYVAATGTWSCLHSSDGANWLTVYSGVRSFTATTFKVGITNAAASPTALTVRVNQAVDILATSTDLRASVASPRVAVPVVVINGTDSTLPATMEDDSGGTSTVAFTGSALRFNHDASQEADAPTLAGARLKYTGTTYREWGILLKLSNPTGNVNTFFMPGGYAYNPTPIDQYSPGGGYGLEIQSGSIRRPIRVDDPTGTNVIPTVLSTGLNEVPYCWLGDLTTYNMRDGGTRWFRIEYIGNDSTHRRYRIREWADGASEPSTWDHIDGQDEVEDRLHGPALALSHNDVKTGMSVFDVGYFEFYRLTGATSTSTSTLPALTQAATATTSQSSATATAASTLPASTTTAAATARSSATAASALPALTTQAVGTVAGATTAAVVSILPTLTATVTATARATATVASVLPVVVVSASASDFSATPRRTSVATARRSSVATPRRG